MSYTIPVSDFDHKDGNMSGRTCDENRGTEWIFAEGAEKRMESQNAASNRLYAGVQCTSGSGAIAYIPGAFKDKQMRSSQSLKSFGVWNPGTKDQRAAAGRAREFGDGAVMTVRCNVRSREQVGSMQWAIIRRTTTCLAKNTADEN